MLHTRGNKLTWLGHATFRITTPSGKVIVIDPWVQTNPMCPEPLKKFDRLDTMLITHGHFDHIADAVALGKQFKPQIVGIFETCVWLESKGVSNTNGMNKGGTQRVGEIEVTMVNAIHSCGIQDGDKIVYGGEACGYIIRLPGGLTIYHAGDTAVFGDMKLIGELYAPDLATRWVREKRQWRSGFSAFAKWFRCTLALSRRWSGVPSSFVKSRRTFRGLRFTH